MKQLELRLGNIIKIKKPILKDLIDEGFQKIYTDRTTVIYIGYDYLGVIIDNSKVDITFQDVEPIPLTEEWLVKFGFKDGVVLENDNYKITISFYDVWRLRYQEKEGYGNADCYLENYWSVHELQNLIFALTGEELTLNK